jgi:thiamine-phosphate pyrophosphorylase
MITDDAADPARTLAAVGEAVAGGVDLVQVRMPRATARAVAALCERLLPVVHAGGAWLLVNDRADVCAAGLADGVHLGQRSLPVERVRRFLPDGALVGVSAHDPAELAAARAGGADHATLSPVFASASKPGVPALGPATASAWTAAAGLPVVWLGGVRVDRVRGLRAPRGFGGLAALAAFADPERARANARALRAALTAILGGT